MLEAGNFDDLIQSKDWGTRATFRAALRRSLYNVAKIIVSYPEAKNLMSASVFKERQDWIQDALTTGKRAIVADPRSYIKSTGCTRSVPIWISIQQPHEEYDHPIEYERALKFLADHPHFHNGVNARILIVGDTMKAARKFTGSSKNVIQSNPIYQWAFPERIHPSFARPSVGHWTDENWSIPGREPTRANGFVEAAGTDSSIVGGRCDFLIINDLIGDHNWKSASEVERLWSFCQTSQSLLEVRDRESPDGGVVIIEGNFWSLDDIATRASEFYPDWAFWRRSVIVCAKHGRGTCGRWGAPEAEGCSPLQESLWPERYPDMESLARLEASMPAEVWSAQYLNDPTRSTDLDYRDVRAFTIEPKLVSWGGKMCRKLCVVPQGEDGKLEDPIPLEALEPHIISIDVAESTESTAARTCATWAAKDPATARRYVLDVAADRWAPDDAVNAALDLYTKAVHDSLRTPRILIEKVAAQSYFAAAMRREGSLRKLRLPEIHLIKPERGPGKVNRGKRRIGNILGQHLLYIRAGLQLPRHEIRHFPTSTLDWIDSMAQAEGDFLATNAGPDADILRANRLAIRERRLAYAGRTGAPL